MFWTGTHLGTFAHAFAQHVVDAGFAVGLDTLANGPTLIRLTIRERESAPVGRHVATAEIRRDFSIVIFDPDQPRSTRRRKYRFRFPRDHTASDPIGLEVDLEEVINGVQRIACEQSPGPNTGGRVSLARHIRDIIRRRDAEAVIGPSTAEILNGDVVGSRVELSDAIAIDVRPGTVVLEIDGESLTRYPRPDITAGQIGDLITAAITTLEDRPNVPRPMTYDHANPDRRTFHDVVDLFRAIRVRLHPEDSRDRIRIPEVGDPMNCSLRIDFESSRNDGVETRLVTILIDRSSVLVTDDADARHSFDVTEQNLEWRDRPITRISCNVIDVVATARALAGLQALPSGRIRVPPNLAAISAAGMTPQGRVFVREANRQERDDFLRRQHEAVEAPDDAETPTPRQPTGESAFGRAVRDRINREREGE